PAVVRFAIFDIETRIDKALVKAVFHRHEDIGEEEGYLKTREQIIARSRSGSDFFPVAFHVPVAIVIGDADDSPVLTRGQTLPPEGDEKALVCAFWDRLEQFRGTLVSF